jgi:hypothetical protein
VRFDAVFVDGCKSWYGTKWFLTEAGRRTAVGCWYVFQDYGWYTCFWLPAFLGVMGDHLDLVMFVDGTYAFQLRRPLAAAEIDRRFPDETAQLAKPAFARAFAELLDAARARGDRRAQVVLTLQHAAALATGGLRDEARQRIEEIGRHPSARGFEEWVAAARRSPTYGPGGVEILL